MGWELLVGLLSIAVAMYFGLQGLRSGIDRRLADIQDKVSKINILAEKTWDLLVQHFFGYQPGTVERKLKNLGLAKITARPEPNRTIYLVVVEKPVLYDGFIAKLSKETGLEEEEKQLFRGHVPVISAIQPNMLRIAVPSDDPKICTKYMSRFLKWLDTTYVEGLARIKEYEEPIQD